jgi:hypothetical protein
VDSKAGSSRTKKREAGNSRETGVIKVVRAALRVRGRVVVRVARVDKVVRADRAVETDSSSAGRRAGCTPACLSFQLAVLMTVKM